LCEQWKETMEDRAQIERLAQAFWKEEEGVSPVPRSAVEALRAARAERDASREARADHRELWKQGRRANVGEDVPSEIGPYRSTRLANRPRSDIAGNLMFEALPGEGARDEA